MAWPTAANLQARLNLPPGQFDDDMDRQIAAGIAWAKGQVGTWDEDFDSPPEALSQAALERAVETSTNGVQAPAVKSKALLYGLRRRFSIG